MTPPARHLRPVDDRHPRRAVLYRRVSAVMGRSGEQFLSPDLQLAAMREMARRRDLVEVDVVDDIDVSGRTFNREGIQRVLEMARRREIDAVALYDLSRLGRNTAESLAVIRELRDLGVAVMSTTEQIDDTPEGQFQLGIWLGLAQLYSDQVRRRWQEVIRHRAERGLFHGSVAPTGYRLEKGGRLVPDPVVAPVVQELYRRYAAGEKVASLTRWFNAATGRKSMLVVVKRLLWNPVYVGRVVVNGEEFPGQHEPLVDARLWKRVQARIALDRRTPSRRLGSVNPLAGVVRCAHCTRLLQMHTHSPDNVRLQCRGAKEIGDCPGVGTPLLRDVEAALLVKVREEIDGWKLDVAAMAERRARVVRARVDTGRLRRELSRVESALTAAAVQRAKGETTAEEHRSAVGVLREEADRLRVLLADGERVRDAPQAEAMVDLAEWLERRWDVLTVEEKNRSMRNLVADATLTHATRYRQPVLERLNVRLL